MLDVIGAGATASSAQNWYEVWKKAPESKQVQDELDQITTGNAGSAVSTELHSEFATMWGYQTWELLKRNMIAHWRNPTYLVAKLVLNAVGGLFIGFTFFKSKDTQQGTQNKLFVRALPCSLFMICFSFSFVCRLSSWLPSSGTLTL